MTTDRRRIARTPLAEAWDGLAPVSREGNASFSQHHITVATDTKPTAGILRIRGMPSGMQRFIKIDPSIEAIDLTEGGFSFVASGFFEAWSAELTTPLTGATKIDVLLSSCGEELAATALPELEDSRRVPITSIANAWDGVGSKSASAKDHTGLTNHHIAFASATNSTGGTVEILAIPSGGSTPIIVASIPLTGVNSGNVIVSGLYDAFGLRMTGAYTGGTIDARVASSGELLTPASSAAPAAGQSGLVWTVVTAGQTILPNQGYTINNAVTQDMTLPLSVPTGDYFVVHAKGAIHRVVSNGNVIDLVGEGNDLTLAAGETVWLVSFGTGTLEVV